MDTPKHGAQFLHVDTCFTEHCYCMYLCSYTTDHDCTDIVIIIISHYYICVYVMIVFVFLLHWSLLMPHGLLLYARSGIPVTWLFPVTIILIFPLLDMWAVDIRCVKLSATWIQATGATSKIPHLLFPVFRYLVSCYQQSSCPFIGVYVSCNVFVPDLLCSSR